MTYVALAEACLIALLLALVYVLQRNADTERSARAEAYEKTLQRMADRIQAPDRLPVEPRAVMKIPEREPDEWAKVGGVDIDPDYGLNDE